MVNQLDLFRDVEEPKGFQYIPDFITPEEELNLIEHFQHLAWGEMILHGVPSRRKIVSFETIPSWLVMYVERGSSLLQVKFSDITQLLVTWYPVGAPIGWHLDAPMYESLLGISLASSCVMKFRETHGHGNYEQFLERRSAYMMKGEARWKWKHHIPPAKQERYSVTMRTSRISPKMPQNIYR